MIAWSRDRSRQISPSEAVLDAIASALRLDPTERAYLYTVARQGTPARRRTASKAQSVRPGLLTLIEQLGEAPAFVLGRRTDVLVANRMARLLLADFNAMPAKDRNAARWLVLDEGARSLFGDSWERVASDIVGTLRMDAAPEGRRVQLRDEDDAPSARRRTRPRNRGDDVPR